MSSSGVIADVHYGDAVMDQSGAEGRLRLAEVQFNATVGCGGIHGVTGRITVLNPRVKLFETTGPVDGIEVVV